MASVDNLLCHKVLLYSNVYVTCLATCYFMHAHCIPQSTHIKLHDDQHTMHRLGFAVDDTA